jgi:hypothetical protein
MQNSAERRADVNYAQMGDLENYPQPIQDWVHGDPDRLLQVQQWLARHGGDTGALATQLATNGGLGDRPAPSNVYFFAAVGSDADVNVEARVSGNLSGFASRFSGVGTDGTDSVAYNGVRDGAHISGGFSGASGSGSFSGAVYRNGAVSGAYSTSDGAAGVFSGKATPALDHAFGTATCTKNC